MFEDDICRCGDSDECPYQNTCYRARPVVGIHTFSNFYECGFDLKNMDCEYYIGEIKKNV